MWLRQRAGEELGACATRNYGAVKRIATPGDYTEYITPVLVHIVSKWFS